MTSKASLNYKATNDICNTYIISCTLWHRLRTQWKGIYLDDHGSFNFTLCSEVNYISRKEKKIILCTFNKSEWNFAMTIYKWMLGSRIQFRSSPNFYSKDKMFSLWSLSGFSLNSNHHYQHYHCQIFMTF